MTVGSGRRALQVGALVWAVGGFVVAASALPDVNADAPFLVTTASVLGPLAAVAAAALLGRASERAAGALLVVSAVVTPTYMAYALNLPALAVGLLLLAAPRALQPSR